MIYKKYLKNFRIITKMLINLDFSKNKPTDILLLDDGAVDFDFSEFKHKRLNLNKINIR